MNMEWKDLEIKPEDGQVVLIHINRVDEDFKVRISWYDKINDKFRFWEDNDIERNKKGYFRRVTHWAEINYPTNFS